MDPAGMLVVPVQAIIMLWPSSTVGDGMETVSFSFCGRDGRGRIVITAVRSAEPTVLVAMHLCRKTILRLHSVLNIVHFIDLVALK